MSYYKQQKPRMIILQHKDENTNELITHSFQSDGLGLSELLEKFRNFAGGMGYYVDGEFVFNSMEDQKEEDLYKERKASEEEKHYEELDRLHRKIDELEDQLYNGNKADLSSYDPFESCFGACDCSCSPTDDSIEDESYELSEEEKANINNCLEQMKAAVEGEPTENTAPRCF